MIDIQYYKNQFYKIKGYSYKPLIIYFILILQKIKIAKIIRNETNKKN